ncbi:MurR/RpiR family transcriptional regulator [Pseudorhodoferax sp.]|uniref:MurR/RpiR family transcriptional regulator n=1 Tax=Pseudorhodoferax sp. TaxID=1993553 RepID=UPI002DD62313|nr:MurR/RpiR family transcriptional regulator [Pseudorhodoferax sp.]
MPPTDEPSASFLARIRELMDQLPPTEQRLGRFILDFPGELASYSASELAGLVGVSNASVTRFVRRLGYAGYEEARRHARDQRSAGSPLYLTPRPAGAPADSLAAHAQAAHDNIAATLRGIDEAALEAIAQAMVQARAVWFLGYRNNRSFAAYLRWQLAQVLPRTQVLPGPGETLAEYAVDIAADDVLVVFALRRSPAVVSAFAQRAAQGGARVVFVTEPSATASAGAHWVLRCHTAAPGVLDSHVALMLLCEWLATRTLVAAGAAGRQRLAGVEAAHEALGQLRAVRGDGAADL